MKSTQNFIFLGLITILSGCLPVSDNREISEADLQPPRLLRFSVENDRTVSFEFDKSAVSIDDSVRIVPDLEIESITNEEDRITVGFAVPQEPGKEYVIEISVEDKRGNSLDILAPFYGFNPRIPDLLINEFTTQGSSTHPDIIEIFVLSDGNMAGVTLYEGTPSNFDEQFVFPPMEITAGSYIVFHTKPEGIPEEIDETSDPGVSGGIDASPGAFDFWLPGGSGLSGNNGVLSVYSSPFGELLDAVLYSNRTSQSDENYRGFGTANVMERADELAETGGWVFEGDLIAPEDAVDPEDSTATRSMCRSSMSVDTDSKTDWHIVPTSTYTFGGVNSDDVYVP